MLVTAVAAVLLPDFSGQNPKKASGEAHLEANSERMSVIINYVSRLTKIQAAAHKKTAISPKKEIHAFGAEIFGGF